MALGIFPVISLADARTARDKAKKLLAAGIDPSNAKKQEKRQAVINAENTFEAVAREWHRNQLEKWSEKHARNVLRLLDFNIFPYIGSRPIADIDAPELLEVLRKIEKRDALYVSGRIKQICGQVFRYGIATGRGKHDHAADLKGALKTGKTKHFAALDIKEMPEFLDALESNNARLFGRTRRAIKLLMLTFVRTSELINATWNEFDLDNAQWEIPAARMKMGIQVGLDDFIGILKFDDPCPGLQEFFKNRAYIQVIVHDQGDFFRSLPSGQQQGGLFSRILDVLELELKFEDALIRHA